MRIGDAVGEGRPDPDDRDELQRALDRLAAEDAQRLAEVRKHVAEDRKQFGPS
jgi:hypothetical protein